LPLRQVPAYLAIAVSFREPDARQRPSASVIGWSVVRTTRSRSAYVPSQSQMSVRLSSARIPAAREDSKASRLIVNGASTTPRSLSQGTLQGASVGPRLQATLANVNKVVKKERKPLPRGSAWWRRRELNPRPKQCPPGSLRACSGFWFSLGGSSRRDPLSPAAVGVPPQGRSAPEAAIRFFVMPLPGPPD